MRAGPRSGLWPLSQLRSGLKSSATSAMSHVSSFRHCESDSAPHLTTSSSVAANAAVKAIAARFSPRERVTAVKPPS